MNAMRNLFHGGILAIWALVGVAFTLKAVFGGPSFLQGLFAAGSWWIWFAAFAALTTLIVRKFENAAAAFLVHGLALMALMAIPKLFPFNFVRLGVDLLATT